MAEVKNLTNVTARVCWDDPMPSSTVIICASLVVLSLFSYTSDEFHCYYVGCAKSFFTNADKFLFMQSRCEWFYGGTYCDTAHNRLFIDNVCYPKAVSGHGLMSEVFGDIDNYPPPGYHHWAVYHDCFSDDVPQNSDKISYFDCAGIYVVYFPVCVADPARMVWPWMEGNPVVSEQRFNLRHFLRGSYCVNSSYFHDIRPYSHTSGR